MKKYLFIFLISVSCHLFAHDGTFRANNDIVYKTIDAKAMKLNLYRPAAQSNHAYPLLLWIHGGAWKRGSKDDFMEKNALLAQTFLKEGYAIASVDYRLSHEAVFPAPLQDIHDAIHFLEEHAKTYNINVSNIVVMGRSAGGHLALLLGISNANPPSDFYTNTTPPRYKVNAIVSFFGPTDLLTLSHQKMGSDEKQRSTPEAKFLGVHPSEKPERAQWASPITYVSRQTSPVLLLHGEKDTNVPVAQSIALKKVLDEHGVENRLVLEKEAKHSDSIFDTEKNVQEVVLFVKKFL